MNPTKYTNIETIEQRILRYDEEEEEEEEQEQEE